MRINNQPSRLSWAPVAQRMKDRRNKAKKKTPFQIKQDERNSKLNIYKILMGVPWFYKTQEELLGCQHGPTLIAET